MSFPLDCSLSAGKDFTSSTKIDKLIQSYIDWEGQISTRATWSGWLWIGLLFLFKYLVRWRCGCAARAALSCANSA